MPNHDKKKEKCNDEMTFVEMLLIMMILYFFYDLILIEKKKIMEPPKPKNGILKILDNFPNIRVGN